MRIHIEELEFQAIIGILDFERTTPQDLIVNLTIDYNYSDEFINYAHVSESIKEHMTKSKFLLIEEALSSLSENLKKEFPLIKSLTLKITKPSILPDCKVCVSDSYKFLA